MIPPTQTALITGASSGIGYELAKLFATNHHNLVLVARSADKMARVADELQRQFGVSAKAVRFGFECKPGATIPCSTNCRGKESPSIFW